MGRFITLTRPSSILVYAVLAFFILFPVVFDPGYYIMRVLMGILLLVILAVSLDVIYGYTGQMSLGHAAFYCIGAYTSTLLVMRMGWPFWLALPASGIMAVIFSVPVGYISFQFKGIIFAIVTFAFGEITRVIASIWDSLTRGELGIIRIPRPSLHLGAISLDFESIESYYFLTLGVTVISVAIMGLLVRSNLGRVFTTIREEETLASSLGINTWRYKMIAFGISAFFAGIAGSLTAHYLKAIMPLTFNFTVSFTALLNVIIGGAGTILGPIIACFVLAIIPEFLHILGELRLAFYGVVLVLVVILLPNGIIGAFRGLISGRRKGELVE